MKAAPVAAVWRKVPGDLYGRLARSVATSLARAAAPTDIFLRADDVAVPGENFQRLMEIFRNRQVPLNLAVVPAWLTPVRWRTLSRLAGKDSRPWCWHQHGWRHANHELEGKKQEFGPKRALRRLEADLVRGRQRLEEIMGETFYPVFTPPWNRCDERTLERLNFHGYRAVSRSTAARPDAPPGIIDIPVNVDLHTRREQTPAEGWRQLLRELENGLESGRCGVMIHHQRMNPAAFEFLDLFLGLLNRQKNFRWVHFRDLTQ